MRGSARPARLPNFRNRHSLDCAAAREFTHRQRALSQTAADSGRQSRIRAMAASPTLAGRCPYRLAPARTHREGEPCQPAHGRFPGSYRILVADSSRNVPLSGTTTLGSAATDNTMD